MKFCATVLALLGILVPILAATFVLNHVLSFL